MERLKKTIEPKESFSSKEEWLEAIGVRPAFRQDGSSIHVDVDLDDVIYLNRISKGIQVFTRSSWKDFASHTNSPTK